jgi:hypothetical protein
MTNRQPSLLRRLYPAVALTGIGFGLVNVLDRPVPVGSAGAPDSAAGEVDPATATTVIAGDQAATAPAPITANSVAAQGQAAPSAPAQAPEATVAPQAQATTAAPPATQAPAAPAADDCGTVTRTGSEATIAWRRTYGVITVTVKATSAGALCDASANWQAYDQKSVRYEDYAVPILNKQAEAAGGANIQGVSGATAVSQAYQQSLQSALDQL